MKTPIFSFVLFIFSALSLQAQSLALNDLPVRAGFSTEKAATILMPHFPGGNEALYAYLSEHLIYPFEARELGIEGKVVLEIQVNEKGQATVSRIVQSLNPACDAAARNAVEKLPRWRPALHNGHPVAKTFNLPILFQLD